MPVYQIEFSQAMFKAGHAEVEAEDGWEAQRKAGELRDDDIRWFEPTPRGYAEIMRIEKIKE